MLPNILTLANAGCGLLAISKAIDALAAGADPARFDRLLEFGCWLIVFAGVLDALDGRIARMTESFSDFGAQLDSFADAITFGVAPAVLAKVLLEHESAVIHPRVNFLAAGAFSLMAILRLARFNLHTDHDDESHRDFQGLPTPGAAGMVAVMMLMYLSLSGAIEISDGRPTPVGRGMQFLPGWLTDGLLAVLLPTTLVALPVLGLLMVSHVRYSHAAAVLFARNARFPALVRVVFMAGGLYLAPVPVLFGVGVAYVLHGVVRHALQRRARARARREERQEAA